MLVVTQCRSLGERNIEWSMVYIIILKTRRVDRINKLRNFLKAVEIRRAKLITTIK